MMIWLIEVGFGIIGKLLLNFVIILRKWVIIDIKVIGKRIILFIGEVFVFLNVIFF